MANKEKLKHKKPTRKSHPWSRQLVLVALAGIVIVLFAGLTYLNSSKVKTLGENDQNKKKKVVYVRQYSDLHITENAKRSDSRFESLTFENRSSLLGNAISSIKKNSWQSDDSKENGSWLWTPILQITPAYRDRIIKDSKEHGVKNLYLSIDSYLDIFVMPEGEERARKKKEFDRILSDFVTKAKENGMSVDAEAGWRNWAEMGNSYKAFVTLNYAIDFNNRHENKLRGFQYDVEPYLLDYYKEDSKEVLGNFVNLIDESVARLDGTDLKLSVVIPEFYDNNYAETPEIFYAGQTLYPFEQLLRVLDKREGSSIIIMAYRNFAEGEDGSIDISKDEIEVADKYKTKVVVALETGEVEPKYVTFFNLRKSYFKNQQDLVIKSFKDNKSYGGVATHYINALSELR